MTRSDFPSLNSLRAFANVAETGSYSRAGTALNVSHAAVSQQVKALEARLGVALVVREGRGITLTAEGAALARDLATGFAAIHRGVECKLISLNPLHLPTRLQTVSPCAVEELFRELE